MPDDPAVKALYPVAEQCQCSMCSEPLYTYDPVSEGPMVANNVHGELRPCERCGRPKTEYVDHGSWGDHRCWHCTERAGGPATGLGPDVDRDSRVIV